MRAQRIPLALLAPISLVVLVVALGALQYRWVGQVSEAERDQLRQSLDRRAREFAEDFDRELGRAHQIFRVDGGFSAAEPDRMARQIEEWRSVSRFAGLVKHAYIALPEGQSRQLARFDRESSAFTPMDWPASLEPVRRRLAEAETRVPLIPAPPGGPNILTISLQPVMPDVPALVIPQASPGRGHVILEIDREFVAASMLPTLAEVHFPETGADRYRVAVVDSQQQPLLSRGLLAGEQIPLERADAAAPLFGLRVEVIRGAMMALPRVAAGAGAATWSSASKAPAGGTAAIVTMKPGASETSRFSMVIEERVKGSSEPSGAVHMSQTGSSWTLLLQHGAGSLDAAVARIRTRNLYLSFGILSVLAASAGLVMINARRSEKLAAQQMDFVATVSHELRTPVAVIRSAAQNLSAGVVRDPDQAKRYGELIDQEGRRLTDMVEQVLEYAGLTGARRPPASRPVDAAALAHDVIAAASSLPEAAGITFDAQADPGLPRVMADEDAIRRALHNLIGNAMKYAADGGWIGVTVSRGTGRDDGHVLIAVADRGRGIPASEISHIFDPFYRGRFALDRQIHGNGLGLSLVKRIAEAHGGRVTVKSAPGQGSTFTMHLPVAMSAVVGQLAPVQPAHESTS
jgi:signal transduction histidine kinase